MSDQTSIQVTETIPVATNIDPMTRIEGHLGIKIEVANSTVTNAWSSGFLWRGFEQILLGRDPRDAPIITQRICGVCHAVHRLTSVMALENAAGVTPTEDAVRIRNIEQGINFVYSHAAHIFVLAGPDYDLYGLVEGLNAGTNLAQYYGVLKDVVLPAQRLCHEIGAIFGGKTPHHMTTLPGGVTCAPRTNAINAALEKMTQIRSVLNEYAPLVLGYLENHKSELEAFGVGCKNFLAYGVFPDSRTGELLLRRGVYVDGEGLKPLDPEKITESVRYSWYTDNSGGKPAEETPPQSEYGKSSAYSWLKSPRYEGKVFEVGPLARMIMTGLYPAQASVYDRLKARALEMMLLVDKIETWIRDLTPGSQVYVPYQNPPSAIGLGLWEAPRGANGHWIATDSNASINHYQIVSPTNWNASPRDDVGQLGPIEQALIGAPIADIQKPMNANKTVRSFDPCTACAVHVISS